jgi:hypothetical protein
LQAAVVVVMFLVQPRTEDQAAAAQVAIAQVMEQAAEIQAQNQHLLLFSTQIIP